MRNVPLALQVAHAESFAGGVSVRPPIAAQGAASGHPQRPENGAHRAERQSAGGASGARSNGARARARTAPMARRRDGDIAPYRQAARVVCTGAGAPRRAAKARDAMPRTAVASRHGRRRGGASREARRPSIAPYRQAARPQGARAGRARCGAMRASVISRGSVRRRGVFGFGRADPCSGRRGSGSAS